MKTYKAIERLSGKARNEINNVIELHEKYKNCYHWTPARSASARRSNESKFEQNFPEFKLLTKKGEIEVSAEYSESCRNCYYKLHVYVDGSKANIRALKNLL